MDSLFSWFSGPSENSRRKALVSLLPSSALFYWVISTPKPEEESTDAPAIASMTPGISWINQVRAFIWNNGMIQKGYDQHKDGMFRMPFMGQWATVVSGKYITEMIRAPDTVLSFQEMLNDSMQLDLTVGPEIAHDAIHLPIIRTLTRNLEAVYPEILDETRFALAQRFEKDVPADGWVTVNALNTFSKIIGELNHRGFVGLPLCRDEAWAKTLLRCQNDLTIRGLLLRAFPKSTRPNAKEYLANYGSAWGEGIKLLTPVIEERKKLAGELPNDLLTWIMTRVPGEQPSLHVMISLFLLIDLVAQNTTAMTFVHAILYAAAYPDEIQQVREEVLEIVGFEGWSRQALEKMKKLDSFVRETQRLSGMSNASINRVALKDFTFSNGVRIPKGNIIQAIGNPLHHDPTFYPDPEEFKPFRFYELSLKEEKGSKKYDMVTPSEEWLAWGRGKHACPGRWYASMVVKHLLAYLLAHYDIKLEDSAKGKRPADWYLAGGVFPSTTAKVQFKKREDVGGTESMFLR